jgi:hypothetical protein
MNRRVLSESRSVSEAVAEADLGKPRQVPPSVETHDDKRFLHLSLNDGYGAVEEAF